MENDPKRAAWDARTLCDPHDQVDKADRVRRMFNAIAPTYERVNRVFSAGRDGAWRRTAVERVGVQSEDEVLDIACGTGDFVRAFAASPTPPRHVVGCDFAHEMLRRGIAAGPEQVAWCECDGLRLPFHDGSFTITSCAFGVRNFQSLETGLGEMYRVLRPGGRALILEFTRPANRMFRAMYEVYARHIMPVGARWLSHDREGAYRYLPESVVSFVDAPEMTRRLRHVGFGDVQVRPLTLGIVTVYVAVKDHDA
jgi:demethylmenaquinone methyltransferase/2-methoxy-6-polyprenyl-1,4-benzoquinol methylase